MKFIVDERPSERELVNAAPSGRIYAATGVILPSGAPDWLSPWLCQTLNGRNKSPLQSLRCGILLAMNTLRLPIHRKSDESKRTVKAAGPADQVSLGRLIQDPKVSFSEDKIVLEEILPVNHAPNVFVTAITIDRKTGWFEVKRVSYSTGRTTIGTDYRFGACAEKGGHF
jgi:hypothetical protein